jgi:hypothetical protein
VASTSARHLDDERLAEQRADVLAEKAGEDVDATPGRVRHDDADRTGGISLLRAYAARGGHSYAGKHEMASSNHAVL